MTILAFIGIWSTRDEETSQRPPPHRDLVDLTESPVFAFSKNNYCFWKALKGFPGRLGHLGEDLVSLAHLVQLRPDT